MHRIIKLITGEEIIAKLNIVDELDTIYLNDPRIIKPMFVSGTIVLNFVPYTLFSDVIEQFAEVHILAQFEPEESIIQAYQSSLARADDNRPASGSFVAPASYQNNTIH